MWAKREKNRKSNRKGAEDNWGKGNGSPNAMIGIREWLDIFFGYRLRVRYLKKNIYIYIYIYIVFSIYFYN
jgi:hypothetical protein